MANNEIKAWNERSNEEKQESINQYKKMILATAIKQGKEFWKEDKTKEQIDKDLPYNVKTGEPYIGVTSALLQVVANINGYENNQFVTMKQANTMGGKLKPLTDEKGKPIISEKTGKQQYAQGVKMALWKTYELVPKLDDNKQPIVENDKPVFVKKYFEKPVLETTTLYHVSQFDNLDHSKFKEKNMENLEKLRYENRNTAKEPRIEKELHQIGLHDKTRIALHEYLNSQSKGLDYKVPEIAKTKSQEQTQTQAKTQNVTKPKNKGAER